VRRVIQWTLLPVAVIAVSCTKSDSKSPTAMNADLQRDLKLASQTQNLKINPDEVAPQSHQELSLKIKRAPDGNKVIRTQHPTVKASARPTQVAEIPVEIPQVQVMASAPAPSETPSTDAAPPLARPSPMPTEGAPGADRLPAANRGSGGILGGIFGAVLRGGVVDDDHCDPRGAPPRAHPIGGDIYSVPGTGGMIQGRSGGMIGGGRPVSRGRPR
jgi:hypothetical protein